MGTAEEDEAKTPVHHHECTYKLDNLNDVGESDQSGDNADPDIRSTDGAAAAADVFLTGGLQRHDHPSQFLLQAAVFDPDVARFLAPSAVVYEVFGTEKQQRTSAHSAELLPLRKRVQEEVLMLNVFVRRQRTPVLLKWLERDHLLYNDFLEAAVTSKNRLQQKLEGYCFGGFGSVRCWLFSSCCTHARNGVCTPHRCAPPTHST